MRLSVLAFTLALSLPSFATSHLEVAYQTGEQLEKPMVLHRLVEFTKARKMPELRFDDEQGKEITLSSFKGDVVLLNLWATWCGPCRKELPEMDSLSRHFEGKGLTIVPLNIDEEAELPIDVRNLLIELNLPNMQTWYDPENDISNTLPLDMIPASYFFDGEGNLVAFVRGYLDWESKGVVPYLEKFVAKYRQPQKI